MDRGGVFGRVQRPAAAVILVGVFVLALANRLLPVLRGGGLSSVLGYDDAVYYAGAVPGTSATANWDGWNRPSTRAWFAEALWRALDSHWGVDRVE